MKRSSHRRAGVPMLRALVHLAACGVARVVTPLTIRPATITAPHDAPALASHEAAVRELARILVRDLRLPMPTTFPVYVYGGRQPFEQGLVQDAQVAPVRAA